MAEQDIRDAIQNMIPLDTPVPVDEVVKESVEEKVQQVQGVLGLAAAIDRSNAKDKLPPKAPIESYDRSALVAEITKKPTQPSMSQEELEESRKTFDRIGASGKTLDMMLNHLMSI
jgi:hypothetical protein